MDLQYLLQNNPLQNEGLRNLNPWPDSHRDYIYIYLNTSFSDTRKTNCCLVAFLFNNVTWTQK